MDADDILDQLEELIDTISPNQRQRLANVLRPNASQINAPPVPPIATPKTVTSVRTSQPTSPARDTGAATFGSMAQQLAPVSAPSIPQAGERVVRHQAKTSAKPAVTGITGEPKGSSMMATADKIVKGPEKSPDTSGIGDLGAAMGAMARSSSQPETDPKKAALFQPKPVAEFYSKFLDMLI